jgi:hypothetical protein
MVYVTGVDHLIQYENGIVPDEIFGEFRDYLLTEIRRLHVTLLAEEFSLEALRDVYQASESTVRAAAQAAGIEHRFCDTEAADRMRLGIPCFADLRDEVKRRHMIEDRSYDKFRLRRKIDEEASDLSKGYWDIREEFWWSRIADRMGSNIIFLCGHEHAERFAGLVMRKGSGASLLDPFWKRDFFRQLQKTL